jgi:hypothetical protein
MSSTHITSMPTYPPPVVSRQLTPRCAVASPHLEPHVLLPPVVAPAGFQRQPLGDNALAQHAMLAKLSWPKARRLGHCIALPCAHLAK